MIEYKIVSGEDLQDTPLADEVSENWNTGEYNYAVVRYENGEPSAVIGTDGGEPEDNTLYRDWSWIAGALNDAYRAGVIDGREQVWGAQGK